MRIDSHQHFWMYSEKEYGWIDDSISLLRRDFLPSDLSPLLAGNSLEGAIAVQARQSDEETDFLLRLATLESGDCIKGVVGWADLLDPNVADRLKALKSNPLMKGFRHILQGESPGFMLQTNFLQGVQTLSEMGHTYDLLVYSHQLTEANQFVKSISKSRIVLDHGAKPKIRLGEWNSWADAIHEIAKNPNLFCKVSGLAFESDWETWNRETLRPYIRHLVDCFGRERLMFGSDWPVCLPAGDYGTIVQEIEACLPADHVDQVMGKTAAEFYGL